MVHKSIGAMREWNCESVVPPRKCGGGRGDELQLPEPRPQLGEAFQGLVRVRVYFETSWTRATSRRKTTTDEGTE